MNNKLIISLGALITLITLSMSTFAQSTIDKQDVSVFPEAEKGYKKLVIEVPHSDNDQNKKIEFTVGKWMDVDGCNYYNLAGRYEKKDLQGWGYDYFVFTTKGEVSSTLMGCPDAKGRNLFVTAAPQLVNYNGKLPIVIYVPEGYDVQFKIYKSDGENYQAAEVRKKK